MTDLVPDGYWDRLETMLTACTKVEEPDHDIDIDFFNQGAIMNDQELLEFAAKAADLNIKAQSINADDHWIGLIVGEKHTKEKKFWNPLTDDGDALRLAVKLNMNISHDDLSPTVSVCASGATWRDEPYGNDPYAATRRAIVRTAAQIGKDMK